MLFEESKPIYLQIGDLICENIINGVWKEGDRIPSVRDFAISLGVNPNTVNRIYSIFQDKSIIINQRGIGYFVADGGLSIVKKIKKEEFVNEDIPNIIRKMKIAGVSLEELNELINKI